MKTVLMVIGGLAALGFIEVGLWALLSTGRKEEERDKQNREGYPWDWTREDEEKVQAALELICDKCHEPFRCSKDELDEACALCPVADVIYKMASEKRKEARG